MKAILVVDVQMTEDGKHICDSCPVWDEKGCMCKYDFMFGHRGCPLKPLPEHKKPQNPDETWEEMHVRMGYNKCLEDITNEP